MWYFAHRTLKTPRLIVRLIGMFLHSLPYADYLIDAFLSKAECVVCVLDEGRIRLQYSELSLVDEAKSSYHTIGTLPWRVFSRHEFSESKNTKYLGFYLQCNPHSEATVWWCKVDVTMKLFSQREGVEPKVMEFTDRFHYHNKVIGYRDFIDWDEVIDPDRGYIDDDEVTLEASIAVREIGGVHFNSKIDFTQPQTQFSDVVLVINGSRLHVSKNYLAQYSPVFAAMFYGEFREREMPEIPLEDVDAEEFTELLHVIYPSRKPVTNDNVKYLLELGQRFDVKFVMSECEKFLVDTEEIETIDRLLWSGQYELAALQDVCIRTLTSIQAIKQVNAQKKYKKLSNVTKVALLEKLLRLV